LSKQIIGNVDISKAEELHTQPKVVQYNQQYQYMMAKKAKKFHTTYKAPKPEPPIVTKVCETPEENLSLADKRLWLIEALKLRESPFLQKSEDLEAALETLLPYFSIFVKNKELFTTPLVKHKIELIDDVPVRCRYKPIPPPMQPLLEEKLKLWLKQGVIEPSNSNYSANVVH